jgi:antitoxin component YwqK of YwqJK toxin-antitoxin module
MSKKSMRLKIYRLNHLPGAELPDATEYGTLQSLEEFDDKGNLLLEIAYTNDGEIGDKNEFHYDENGRLKESRVYSEDDEVLERNEISRDKDGRILKEIVHYMDGSTDTRSYYYDDRGNLTGMKTMDDDDELEFSEKYFYENDKLLKIERRNEEDEIVFSHEDTFEAGVIRNRKVWSSEGEDTFTIVTDFNQNGHRERETRFDSRDRMIERNIFEEDEQGRVIRVIEENRQRKNTTEFSFNDQGNVSHQKEVDLNGDLNHEIFRSYDELGNPTKITVETILKNSGEKRAYSLLYLYEDIEM